ncbi:hypothetical protein [Erwinia sp. V71]|uniref:hypothetical protein n=1 Tax=Erwinia sp. V71 TaxID=3369424 RepID=UPI003F5D9CA5
MTGRKNGSHRINRTFLSWVLQSFLRDNALPFHQRWQGHFPDGCATSSSVRQGDAIALINTLIDPQGNIIDYQLAILRRHLPQATFPDHYSLLQLLSDMLHMTRPDTVPLYRFIRHHLQKTLTRPALSLSTLRQNGFIGQQASEIQHAFITTFNDASPLLPPALQRYTLAAVRHLLSFARFLPLPDPLLAATPLHNLAAQWLNLGAIIAQQLRLKTATAEDLLALSWAAQHDAGLLSLRETGIQQLALLSGNTPAAPPRNEAQDALDFIVLNLRTAAEIQQRLYHCAEASQLLSLQLHDLVYSAMNAEQQDQLRSLAASALLKQRDLLHIALQQLSVSDKLRLSQWQQQGKLDAIWYPANDATHAESKIIGFAFAAENQPKLFLPVAEPLYMPLIFRQLAANADEHQLQALCFGRTAPGNPRWLMMPAVSLNLASPSQDGAPPISDPVDILHTLMEAELASLLARLTGADGEIHFERQKLSLMEWLVRHLFFFDRGGQQDYRFIFGQAQRMASIVEQSHLQHEPSRADAEGIVNPFSQSIRRIMGATTVLPDLVSQLTETTPLYGATAITSLNTNGFTGFWWDPFSQLCYLGWKKGNSRTLYASTPESRDTLYKLADDNAAAEIWPMLARADGLKGELQALLLGTLSNEQFFADALPMAWHLHGALAGASPLPAGAIQHATLSDVWFTREAGMHHYFFSPSGSDSALPVTLETLSTQSYRLHFSPSDGRSMADQGFTLETRPFGIPGQHHWQFIPATSWQLVSAPQADELIRQGLLSPEHYLQWRTESGNPASIRPDAHVLQRSDGCMVFTFHDEHASQTHYRLLDTAGTLQLTTTLPAGWSLLTAKELQFVSRELQTAQRNRLTAITTASALIVPLPFRYPQSSEAQDEWHNINIHLRADGRNFFNEVWQRAQITGPLLTEDELLWLRTDWRATDFYQTEACDSTLKKLAQQQQLLKTMLDMLKQQHDLRALSEELQRWLHQLLHHSQHGAATG